MALEESTENLDKLESKQITAYIDPQLLEHLKQFGGVNIDYITNQMGQSGYRIFLGEDKCSTGKCSC